MDDVPGDQLFGINLVQPAGPFYQRGTGQELLHGRQRSFGLALLHEADAGVEDDHGGNDHRIQPMA